MIKRKKIIMLLKNSIYFFLAFSANIYAAIYMSTDVNGNVTYSDTPFPKSQQITGSSQTTQPPPPQTGTVSGVQSPPKLPLPGTIPAMPTAPTNAAPPSMQGDNGPIAEAYYRIFLIVSPKDNETIQNQPVIPVTIQLLPALRAGDRIQLLLDGTLWGNAMPSVNLQMNQVERGIHTVSAVLVDKSQVVIKQSNVVKIFVHRVGLNSPAVKARPTSIP